MAKGLCPPFDPQAYREGHLRPVYFGSALNNFGVRELLAGIDELAPAPRPQPAEPRPISPDEPRVAGFVFEVQANIDPQHRDRIAFATAAVAIMDYYRRSRRKVQLRARASGLSFPPQPNEVGRGSSLLYGYIAQ